MERPKCKECNESMHILLIKNRIQFFHCDDEVSKLIKSLDFKKLKDN